MARRIAGLILVLVWLAATAAQADRQEPTIGDLAGMAPADSTAFAAFTPRPGTRFDVAAWKQGLGEDVQRQVAQAETWLGTTLEDLFTWARPSGFFVLLSAPTADSLAVLSGQAQAELPDLALALSLRDEAAARRAVERFVSLHGQDLELQARSLKGVSLWAPPEGVPGPALAFGKGHLLVGSPSGVARLARSFQQAAPGLARDPLFRQALGQVPARHGAFLYVPVRKAVAGMHDGGMMEEEILETARAFEYVVTGEVRRGDRWTTDAFLQLQPRTSSPLVWPLLIPARPSRDLAGWIPADVASYASVEVDTFYRPTVALTRWAGAFTGAFMGGQSLPAGALAQALYALEGRLACAVDSGPDGTAEPTLLLAAGVRDLPGLLDTATRLESAAAEKTARQAYDGCASNLSSLSSALEVYRDSGGGKYPDRLGLLVPDYLEALPTCPSAGVDTYSAGYRRAGESGGCSVACQGRNHQDMGVGPDLPASSSETGLEMPEGTPRVTPVKRESRRLQGATVHGYAGLPLLWTVKEKGQERILLLGFGPRAEALLLRSLQAGSGGDSLAEDPAYRRVMEDSQGTVIATGLVRARLLAQILKAGMDDAPPAVTEFFDQLVLEDAVGYVSMESGGVRSVSSTSLSSKMAASLGQTLHSLTKVRGHEHATACKSNLRNIATALEMYTTDNAGRYPTSLSVLARDGWYLKSIPTCPAAGCDTYSASYRSATDPDAYTLFCQGANHANVGYPADYPQYDSNQGLIESP